MATDVAFQSTSAERIERDSSRAWFWWKETRQLFPLVVVLVVVAVLIMALNSVSASLLGVAKLRVPGEVILLVFPGLFAVGAGPLLVGQERTNRTMDWLALLPISIPRLFWTKLLVGAVGLALMWVITLCAISLLGLRSVSGWEVDERSGTTYRYAVWLSHSVYVLLSGFFVAWWIRNQFHSLIALVPIAFAPMLLTSLAASISGRRLMTPEVDWGVFALTLIGIAVMLPLSYWAGARALGPAKALTDRQTRKAITGQALVGGRADGFVQTPTFRTEFASLVWQTIRSAQSVWMILIGALLVSFAILLWLEAAASRTGHNSFSLVIPSLLLVMVAISWMGVCVFKQDGGGDRIRFLADRGIDPWKVYVARQIVPIAIISGSMFLYGVWQVTRPWHDGKSSSQLPIPPFLVLTVCALICWSISQWISQLFRTLLLSVIFAPLMSLITIGWMVYCCLAIGFPLWAVSTAIVVPLLATLVLMPRYMDSRNRPVLYAVAGLVVAILVGAPIVNAAMIVLRVPVLDKQKRAALFDEASDLVDELPDVLANPISRADRKTAKSRANIVGQDSLRERIGLSVKAYGANSAEWLDGLEAIANDPGKTFSVDSYQVTRWINRFHLNRLLAEQAADANVLTEMQPLLTTGAQLLTVLRRSTRLDQQALADQIEVVIVNFLNDPMMSDDLDSPAVQETIARLGTPATRATARRRAALWEWYLRQTRNDFGPRYLPVLQTQPQGLTAWLMPRYEQQCLAALLAGIEACRTGKLDDPGWRRQIHSLFYPETPFQSGPWSDRYREVPAAVTLQNDAYDPARLWGLDWEYITLGGVGRRPLDAQREQ